MESKFKVGDKVEVVDDGYGFSFEEIGSVVTIKEVEFGAYLQGEFGYRIEERTGNNLIEKFDGWHGERSFRLVESANHVSTGTVPADVVALGNDLTSTQEWTDKHYSFSYHLTELDFERGYIKIDPYFVAKQWKIGSKDDSGALWHCFKTIARFGEKNNREREIKALYAQIKRLAELEGVSLEERTNE